MQKEVISWSVNNQETQCKAPEQTCNGQGKPVCYVLYPQIKEGLIFSSCEQCTPQESTNHQIASSFEKQFQEIFQE